MLTRRFKDDDDEDDDAGAEVGDLSARVAVPSAEETKELEERVAQELKMRMEVYERLTVLSALLVGAALFIFTQVGNHAIHKLYTFVRVRTRVHT